MIQPVDTVPDLTDDEILCYVRAVSFDKGAYVARGTEQVISRNGAVTHVLTVSFSADRYVPSIGLRVIHEDAMVARGERLVDALSELIRMILRSWQLKIDSFGVAAPTQNQP